MKVIILIIGLLIFNPFAKGQDLEKLLAEISSNNNRLKALRELTDAQKLSNKTELNLANPEIEFNYLWGDQPQLGNRKDLKVVQSFDFPTSYSHRSQISKLRNNQSDLEYRREYLSVMHSATQLYIEMAYLNSYITELTSRTENSRVLAQAMELRLQKGEANILEYNKAILDYANQQRLLEEQTSRRRVINTEMVALNGGKAITVNSSEPYLRNIEPDFEKWYQTIMNSNPDIRWIEEESLINARMVKLNTSLALPKFTVGYMSESLPDEQFSGITVGMTIPLWEHRNTVKSSRLRSMANQNLAADMQQQYYYTLKANHEKVITLLNNAKKYRSEVESHTNADFLKRAFDSGEISLIEYLTELTFYYESIDQMLSLEREAGIAAAELLYYEK
jgi:cobalt-zinc-cadmium efflux system outer membrane protein